MRFMHKILNIFFALFGSFIVLKTRETGKQSKILRLRDKKRERQTQNYRPKETEN